MILPDRSNRPSIRLVQKIFTTPIIIFLVIVFYFTASFSFYAQAAPSLSGVNGALVNGQSIIIEGTGFGIKNPAAPIVWEDFSRGTNGQPLSTGTGSPWVTQAECVTNYSNATSYGQSSLSAAQIMVGGAPCWTRTAMGILGNQTKVFYSYHWYAVPGSSGTHTKFLRVGCDDDVHCTPNSGYTGFSPNYWYAFSKPAGETAIFYSTTPAGQWVRDDGWQVLGDNGVANGEVWVWRNGIEQAHQTNVVTKDVGSGASYYNQVFLPYYTESATRTVYVGDVYIDNTLSRVEICSGSTWASRGNCEMQIPSAWSASSVSVTVNQGAHSSVANVYVYVVDSQGVANSSGFPVSFGGSSDATPPSLSVPSSIGTTKNKTPSFSFTSDEAGTITYSGSCSSATATATVGENAITLNALNVGTHSNCEITVTDSSGNVSTPLTIPTFHITYPGDLDLNRNVNIFDYNILLTNFGQTNCGNSADIDGNCSVNIFDYNALIGDFGRSF